MLGALVMTPGARAQVLTGSYVGDGVAGRSITGLGFRPKLVVIKADSAQGATTGQPA